MLTMCVVSVSRRHSYHRQQAGFTLLELLVATAIFALLAAMTYQGINRSVFNSQHAGHSLQQLQELQLALTLMQRDFSQIIDRPIRDEFGDLKPALQSGNQFDSILDFTRSGWENPAGHTRSQLQRVSYAYEEQTLYRSFWTTLDRPTETSPLRTRLLSNIETLHFRFLDHNEEWHEEWPPLQAPDGFNGMPRAIELNLEYQSIGEIKRLIALPL